jgi:rubrerythrin
MTTVRGAMVSGMEASAVTERCQPVVESKRLPCDVCGTPMEPEHAHYRCPSCGYILPCCGW